MTKEFFALSLIKIILNASFIVAGGTILGIMAYASAYPEFWTNQILRPSVLENKINKIEISTEGKSILNVETKAIIFTISDTQKYLKDAGYFYNPDTFQATNAKYEGNCFTSAALSNNKDRIVFSTGCLSGDLPQAWIGIYSFQHECPAGAMCKVNPPLFQFLVGGSGRNFVWSSNDKTITYEADLGLSGMTETRIIDSQTGEVLDRKSNDSVTYKNKQYGFEIALPDSWRGYSVLTESWHGTTLDSSSIQYEGPEILIRNPKWSNIQPWQDIPVMVFTKEEWKLIEEVNLGVSAAPYGPTKLDESQKYVFALPPRWIGFTDDLGQDEALEIVKTIKAIPVISSEKTTGWHTYRNEEYGFEFKYPPELKGGASDEIAGETYKRHEIFLGAYGHSSVSFSVEIVPLRDFSFLHPDYSKTIFGRTKIINGINMMIYGANQFVYIPLPKANDYQIEIFNENIGDVTDKNFDSILSTFKFIEPEK